MGFERVILTGVIFPHQFLEEFNLVQEFETLTHSAGGVPVAKIFQHRNDFDPAYAIGKGKCYEILQACQEKQAESLLFMNDLTPTQQRNLEQILNRKVVDRTSLILDIFAQRARSREGKLQVELAQLRYRLPRLAGSREALSRLGGGIGTRGPGEQKLEVDRRRILDRIKKLEEEIEKVKKHRQILRQGRDRYDFPLVSMVGYTNAGKTSLLNALTRSQAYVASTQFATLDPLIRKLYLSKEKTVLLSDTVGFVRDFPPHLAKAFHATLEELESANLLLHVADGSHPNVAKQITAVSEILEELNLEEKPTLFVLNKLDQINSNLRKELKKSFPKAYFVSAKVGEGLEELKEGLKNSLSAV